ncbi:MAG: argininosuccinate lyase [bacterium]|nr:MAG: argininosuccinate lyase [bacterium]
MTKKPWQGRLEGKTSIDLERFSESISFDHRLYPYDIEGSIAHARMLGERGIISEEDARSIVGGLERIRNMIDRKEFTWDPSLEDVHMNIEHALTEMIGDAGAKLHTGRSRNDQVALDLRIFLREEVRGVASLLKGLLGALLNKAEAHFGSIAPGYTHLQRAQPILISHHLMAYFEMFRRDLERFRAMTDRLSESPLGSGALAGTALPIDRESTARELGFSGLTRNSMDSVSDRDFAAEFLFAVALCQIHLSRVAEEMVIWSTSEFAFVRLPDSYCTGSSMMPQKKNPDPAELVRGKTGRAVGNLISLLVTLKGLPMAYNRDLQEDKEPVFDSLDTLTGSIGIMTALLTEVQFDTVRMEAAAAEGFSTATDLADYLVARNVPFRQAHEIVGRIVKRCIEKSWELQEMPLAEMRAFSELIESDVFESISLRSSIEGKDLPGGTASGAVRNAIKEAREYLDQIPDR